MKHVALKPFGWYPDGFTREALDVGAERDFGTSAAGMKAAGMIGEIKPTQAVVVAEASIAPPEAEIAPQALATAEELDLAVVADVDVAEDGAKTIAEVAYVAPRRGRPKK